MYYLIATMHTLGAQLQDQLQDNIEGRARAVLDERHRDRGSVSMDQVIWAVAVIAIAGVVVAAVTAYVKKKAGQIQ
ncbi:hypothetical protein [Segeticoccus rhizosphaerae]|uniref:hypothetical protein n=1 Tax=Segeticoccus rhizosphaerae TaxID=1104777 RepID=UPI001264826D|nr:hypothetical protein [Segeticoccus rhizosphaerae]